MNKQDGYVLDAAYPPHYHRQMQPLWLGTQAGLLGARPPGVGQPYGYCELGCGVGLNLLVAAALNPLGRFVGVDFNERHVAWARQAADAIGLDNVSFARADFVEFALHCAQRPEERFDFIAAHGVWSWVSPAVQQDILRIVELALDTGGLFYLHYMCHPGATCQAPIQKFLHELAGHLACSSEDAVKAGISLLDDMAAARVFDEQVLTAARRREIRQYSPAFWAHEYLTDHWQPQHSVDVHRRVAAAGVRYIGSADAFDNLDKVLSVPASAHGVLERMPSPALGEMVKDLARNSRQRMDLFQKAPAAGSSRAHEGAIRFGVLPGAPQSAADGLRFATPIGAIDGPAGLFSPLLLRLHREPRVPLAALADIAAFSGDRALLLNCLQLLVWRGYAHPARPDPLPESGPVARLQRWLAENGLELDLVPECATAVHRRPA